MPDQAIQLPIIIVIGIVISVIGFILIGLIGIVGYFLKQAHNDYKEDRKNYQSDKKTFDEKIEKVADIFANKLELIADKIGHQIDEVKSSVTLLSDTVMSLTGTMQQIEKDAASRYVDIHKRLDEHHDAIEIARGRLHEQGNTLTKLSLALDLEKRKNHNSPSLV